MLANVLCYIIHLTGDDAKLSRHFFPRYRLGKPFRFQDRLGTAAEDGAGETTRIGLPGGFAELAAREDYPVPQRSTARGLTVLSRNAIPQD